MGFMKMKLIDVLNDKWVDPKAWADSYKSAAPFPHIVMEDFLRADILSGVENEFPNLEREESSVIKYSDGNAIKLASSGMTALKPRAVELTTYLQSDLMLNWLNELTGIKEPLISDPYLSGGGYHEIKTGGFLNVHADFNKHPLVDLDRRLNLLIYLNKDWEKDWGGELQLFDNPDASPVAEIMPRFNTAVIFTTTSFTYHGHPKPLNCPSDRSRKSLAYYYFSVGRPDDEISDKKHSTLWRARQTSRLPIKLILKDLALDLTPPFLVRALRSLTDSTKF